MFLILIVFLLDSTLVGCHEQGTKRLEMRLGRLTGASLQGLVDP